MTMPGRLTGHRHCAYAVLVYVKAGLSFFASAAATR